MMHDAFLFFVTVEVGREGSLDNHNLGHSAGHSVY